MKKITLNKNDEAAVVVEKIIDADSEEVVLSIPKFSHLAESLSNFHLLKREADALGKKVLIESVDDRVIELAELSGLRAINPFFAKSKKQFSDIVAPKEKAAPAQLRRGKKLAAPKISIKTFYQEEGALEKGIAQPQFAETAGQAPKRSWRSFLPKISLAGFSWKPALVVLLLAGGLWVLFQELPHADIKIVAKKADWAYNDSVLAEKSAKNDPKALTIPNQVFIQKRNIELKFLATGKQNVSLKAGGKITIYNNYSSEPQPLVVNTRFMSPDGKIFRLVKGVIVPGAKISEGKIIPSTLDAAVIADKAGPDYNIGPVKLFTIPGFEGTPKFQAFYGESQDPMQGGFVGISAYPTSGDIAAGGQKISQALQDSLKATIYSQIPSEFKILDDAMDFKVLSQTVKKEVDSDNNFSIFAEAQMTIIGFREQDLLGVLSDRAVNEVGPDFEVKSTELSYGASRPDFQNGQMSFLVNFKAHLAQKIDVNELRSRIAGKSEQDLRAIIFSLPGVESATISFWPFWVSQVPAKMDKVSIAVD